MHLHEHEKMDTLTARPAGRLLPVNCQDSEEFSADQLRWDLNKHGVPQLKPAKGLASSR